MPLPTQRTDREFQKFVEDSAGDTAVRTVVTDGSFDVQAVPSGLRNGGRHSEVSIDDNGFTALPATPLTNRNAIAIQNNTAFDVKLNYSDSIGTYTGILLRPGSERQYDIKDTINLYARAEPGSGTILLDVEEIS